MNEEKKDTTIVATIPASTLLQFALGFSLLAGFLEASYLAYLRLGKQQFILLSRDVYWMAPLALALIMVVPGLFAYGIFKRWPNRQLAAVFVMGLAFLSTLSPSLLFDPGTYWAALLMAFSVSATLARIAFQRPQTFAKVTSKGLLLCVIVLVAILLVVRGNLWWTERNMLAALPELAATGETETAVAGTWGGWYGTIAAINLGGHMQRQSTTLWLALRDLAFHSLIARVGVLGALFLATQFLILTTQFGHRFMRRRSHSLKGISLPYLLGRSGKGSRNQTNSGASVPKVTVSQEEKAATAQLAPEQEADVSRRQFIKRAGATLVSTTVSAYGWQTLARPRPLTAPTFLQARSKQPNVLLIVWDTVRAQNLSLHGYSRPTTPYLDQFARSGTQFTNAIATAPYTGPSHASMFTGQFPHKLSVGWAKPLDDTYPTVAEALSAQGYLTAGFIANISYCTYEYGLNRGFAHYEDWPVSMGQVMVSSKLARKIINSDKIRNAINYHELLSRKNAEVINRDFLHWQGRQDGKRPFFAFLNYFDAHEPFLPPAPFADMFGAARNENADFFHLQQMATRRSKWLLPPEEVATEQNAYDGAIAYLDQQLKALLQTLDKRGVLEDTLVIVTSDHGEQFGDRRLFGHGTSLYRQETHVPLVFSHPTLIPSGQSIPEAISLRNLPATILDITGDPNPAAFPGISLGSMWGADRRVADPAQNIILAEVNGRRGNPEWYPVSRGDVKALVADGMHYIYNSDGGEELFDFERDLLDENDLAADPAYATTLAKLRQQLKDILP